MKKVTNYLKDLITGKIFFYEARLLDLEKQQEILNDMFKYQEDKLYELQTKINKPKFDYLKYAENIAQEYAKKHKKTTSKKARKVHV